MCVSNNRLHTYSRAHQSPRAFPPMRMHPCVHVCMCAHTRARVCACMRACGCACALQPHGPSTSGITHRHDHFFWTTGATYPPQYHTPQWLSKMINRSVPFKTGNARPTSLYTHKPNTGLTYLQSVTMATIQRPHDTVTDYTNQKTQIMRSPRNRRAPRKKKQWQDTDPDIKKRLWP